MNDDTLLRETTEYLHRHIPITRAMDARVAHYDGRQLVVTAPLALNHNHLGTAFGGSLATVATLAGYAFVWLELEDRTAHVVIRRSATRFLRPVRGDLRAICHAPDPAVLARFRHDFARKGRARLDLRVEIVHEEKVSVEFEATFVAIRQITRPAAE